MLLVLNLGEELLKNLRAAGVTLNPLVLVFPSALQGFRRVCSVARPAMFELNIGALISRIGFRFPFFV